MDTFPSARVSTTRLAYVGLAIATIMLGLWLHWGAASLGADARDIAGDALWAMMMTWWVGAFAPRARLFLRAAAATGVCLAVELSQLIHTAWLDAIRSTTLGHLTLGSGFDPRDLVSYGAGVLVAVLLEGAAHRHAGG